MIIKEIFPIADCHVHTAYCGHAHGKISEYIEVAILKGLQEICFTDHLERYYLKDNQKKKFWDWGMNKSKLHQYFMELEDAQNTYKDTITIRTGLEVDYVEGFEDLATEYLDEFPCDFVLGSVHCLPTIGWKHIAHYTQHNPYELYKEYFRVAKELLKSGIFNSISHLDFIWRYIHWPEKNSAFVFEQLVEIVETAAAYRTAIEVNANGYLWSQIYNVPGGDPFVIMLDQIRIFNVPITIGSDAHKPEMVGKAFPDIAHFLKNNGHTHYTLFDKREKQERIL